jgi:hypothetical protein
MPRNISFSMTADKIRDRTKTVTRRLGWTFLKPGTVLNACVKCMGLRKGEKIERICQIKVVSVRREFLYQIGLEDDGVAKEGYPEMRPIEFIRKFSDAMNCHSRTRVTRIEFEYV